MEFSELKEIIDFFNNLQIDIEDKTTEEERKNGQKVVIATYKFKNKFFKTQPLYYKEITKAPYVKEPNKVISYFGEPVYWLDIEKHKWNSQNPNINQVINDIAGNNEEFKFLLHKVNNYIQKITKKGRREQYGHNLETNNHWHDLIFMIKNCIENKGEKIDENFFKSLVYEWQILNKKTKNKARASLSRSLGKRGFIDTFQNNIKNYFQQLEQLKQQQMKKYISLLINTKNLIFHGAPGTGKTYLAKQIAWEMIKNNDVNIKELVKEYLKVGDSFDVKLKDGEGKDKKEKWKISEITEDKIKGEKFSIEYDKIKNCFTKTYQEIEEDLKNKYGEEYLTCFLAKYLYENHFIGFVQFHPSYDYTDFVEGLRPEKKGDNEIGFKIEDGIFKEFCKKAKDDPNNNYVFIIDEINRADISKVFGELFFSLDPDYRGKKGEVGTQYYNMHGEKFFIPENVYIIGTMNDIDRSVDTFDFAIRRRFTWIELKAEDVVEKILNENTIKDEELLNEAKKRLDKLNKKIEKIEGLNESYHIGPAYFLKLNNYLPEEKDKINVNEVFEKLWEYHLEPLLREYVRGMPDADCELENLAKTYGIEIKKSKCKEENT